MPDATLQPSAHPLEAGAKSWYFLKAYMTNLVP